MISSESMRECWDAAGLDDLLEGLGLDDAESLASGLVELVSDEFTDFNASDFVTDFYTDADILEIVLRHLQAQFLF